MNYFPFHIGDYVRATRHLTWDEDCAYRRLLDVYYTTEKPIPLDLRQVFRLVVASNDAQREAVQTVLAEFFEQSDVGYISRRADAEILAMQEKQEKQRERANKRWQYRDTDTGKATAMPRHSPGDATAQESDASAMPPTPTPTPTPTPIVNTPSNEGVAQRKRSAAARPDDVAEPVWQDFQRLRAQKRSPLTDTALAGLRREADKAGVGLEQAIAFCCEQGWQAFNAGWYAERTGGRTSVSRNTTGKHAAAARAIYGASETDSPGVIDVEATVRHH